MTRKLSQEKKTKRPIKDKPEFVTASKKDVEKLAKKGLKEYSFIISELAKR